MWWEPSTRAAEEVSEFLDRLDALEGRPHWVIGHGTVFDVVGPLAWVLVDHELDPRQDYWSRDSVILGWVARVFGRLLGPLPTPPWALESRSRALREREEALGAGVPRLLGRLAVLLTATFRARTAHQHHDWAQSRLTIPWWLADAQTRSFLAELAPPEETYVSYVGAKERLLGLAAAIDGRRGRVTAGIVVRPRGSTTGGLIATAGHLGSDLGDLVVIMRRRRILRTWRPVGTGQIVDCRDPQRELQEKNDIALVRVLDGIERLSGTVVEQLTDSMSVAEDDDAVIWTGSISGETRGTVIGALRNRTIEGREYRNVWTIEAPSHKGDSGSGVFLTATDRVLGLLIARGGSKRKEGTRNIGYVQDFGVALEAIQQHGPDEYVITKLRS